MRWLLLALPLALAACSSDPAPPADSGPLDTGPADTGADVLITHDWLFIDAGEDRPALVDTGSDAGAVDSVADVLAIDAADAGADVVAVADAGALEDVVDVQLVDVAADRPDVVAVDVLRDAGPVDGGPVVYDLNEPRTTESAVLLMARVCIVGCDNPCDAVVVPGECRLASDGLHFSLPDTPRCSLITGLTRVGTTGTVTVTGGGAPAQSDMTVTTQGASYVAGGSSRRNFHVQFSAPRSGGTNGVTGIPGRTVSPTLGDVWLFGCRVE